MVLMVVKFHLACLRMIGLAIITFCDRFINNNCYYQRSQAIPKEDNALLQAKFTVLLRPHAIVSTAGLWNCKSRTKSSIIIEGDKMHLKVTYSNIPDSETLTIIIELFIFQTKSIYSDHR